VKTTALLSLILLATLGLALNAWATETYVGTIRSLDGGSANNSATNNLKSDGLDAGAVVLTPRVRYAFQCGTPAAGKAVCYQVGASASQTASCSTGVYVPSGSAPYEVVMPPQAAYLAIMPADTGSGVAATDCKVFKVTQ
jgi:hypothetical protein